jgi:hypothetical protein
MKNLLDVMKRVTANPEAPETDADDEDEDAIQLFSGTNFINLDIDNAETLVSLPSTLFYSSNSQICAIVVH